MRLIGRDRERATIEQALHDSLTSSPQAFTTMLLVGEAGIGKSTLLGAAGADAARNGFRVLEAACGEVERDLPYSALVDLLGPAADEVGPALPSVQRDALDYVLLRGSAGDPVEPRVVAMTLLGALTQLAQRSPLALLIDDLHWIDASSGRALAFALRRLDRARVVLIGSVRHRLPAALDLARAGGRMRRIQVPPLNPDDIAELLAGQLPRARSVPAVHRILELADGNPLFAVELSRAHSETPGLLESLEAGPELPQRLMRLMDERLRRLPARTRRAVARVALVARPSDWLLGQMHISVADLQVAVDAGVLRTIGAQHAFTHPLLRSAAAASLSAREKRALHLRLAELVTDKVERAGHVARSLSGPKEAAAGAVELGAREASNRGAPIEAAVLAERAVQLTEATHPERRFGRALLAARFRRQAGDYARAETLLTDALSLAPTGHRADALLELARVEVRSLGGSHERYRAALRAATNARTRAEIRLELAAGLRHSEQLGVARRQATVAVREAEASHDGPLLARCLGVLTLLTFNATGRLDVAAIERILRLEKPALVGPSSAALPELATVNVAHQLVWSGRFARARQVLDHLATVPAGKSPMGQGDVRWYSGLADWWTGRWKHAEVHFEAVVRAGEARGDEIGTVGAKVMRGVLAVHRGEPQARSYAQETRSLAEAAGSLRFVAMADYALGFLSLAEGDPHGAADRFETCLEVQRRLDLVVPSALLVVPEAIEAQVGAGRLAAADDLIEEYARRARRWQTPMFHAGMARGRAIHAMARGELATAARVLEPWLRSDALKDLPFVRARTLLVAGSLSRRQRHRRQARQPLEESREVFDQLGAGLWLARADDELTRLGDRAPLPDELTPAESQVAGMAAQGHSNREIADELFLSVKTIEWYLTHVYAKLGVRSRSQLAARSVQLRTGDASAPGSDRPPHPRS
jgi:DNA-binding CsgD family transcriptional regulator